MLFSYKIISKNIECAVIMYGASVWYNILFELSALNEVLVGTPVIISV